MIDNERMEYDFHHMRASTKDIQINYQIKNKTNPPKLHFHDTHEVLLILDGKYKLYAPKLFYEGDGACILITKSGVYHGCVRKDCETTPFIAYDLNFTVPSVKAIPTAYFDGNTLFDNDVTLIPLDSKEIAFLEPKFREMYEEMKPYRKDKYIPPLGYGLFLTILNYLTKIESNGRSFLFEVESDEKSGYYISEVIKTTMCMVDNGEDVSVNKLAERFYVSTSKLSYDFRKMTGLPLKRMIDELRLKRAQGLLRTNTEIKEIAKMCGFSSESYFIQFFKRHTDMSPGKYREMKYGSDR